jgi:nucleoside-diphosphate-sugar epimerase
MKIAVIGGTGLIESKLVEQLREDGHEPLAPSPDTGVNTITGDGLADAFEGAHGVADVVNAPVWDDAAVIRPDPLRGLAQPVRNPGRTS